MNAASLAPGSTQPFRGVVPVRRLVPLLVVVASVGYLCRVDMTVVAPYLMAEFHLSQPQMGEVFSAFLLGYTAFQIPSGWVADRVGTRSLFLGLTLGWALLTAAAAAVGWPRLGLALGALPALLLLRVAFGILAAPTYPAAARAIAVTVPARLQGRANGAVLASIGIGSAVTPMLLGSVSVRWGWRPALLGAAALAALAGVLWWGLAPGTPAAGVHPTGPATQVAAAPWLSPLRQRSFWFLAASYTLQGYVGYIFVFWFYLYLVQVRHFELLKAAWLTTLPWLLSLVAIPLGGVASDWAVKHWGSTWGRRAVPLPALALSAGLLALGARTESATLAVASLTLSTALVLSSEGPFWATMNQLSGPHSGTGGGVMNFGSNLGGLISPVATPWLASRFGWSAALSLTAALAVVGSLLWMGVEVRQPDSESA
jgi:ACS family glucarate transporter-like MFS transporter